MVIDCFTFFNELDLLEVRLNTLNEVVDYFVLVEAGKTQTLKEKPFYFEENKSRFEKFLSKIIHVKVDSYPNNESDLWTMENYQRNQIKKGLEKIEGLLSDNDLILISDLDEIPNPNAVLKAKEDISEFHALAFDMSFHAYYVNLISPRKGWIGTVGARWEALRYVDPQDFRRVKDGLPRFPNAGWHLSWLGGWEKAYQKLNSCIEPLDKSEVPSPEVFKETFERRVRNGGHFHLTTNDDSVPLEVNDDSSILPRYLVENKDSYSNLFI